jgi:hypothetical protein
MVMERAIKLVEAGWTQHTYARNKEGTCVNWRSEVANSFCAMGAILRAAHEVLGEDQSAGWIRIAHIIAPVADDDRNLMYLNDTTDKEGTLAAMRRCLNEL